METIDCIRTRRSIRKYQPIEIPEEVLYVILESANQAPCAGGLQTWRFIVVGDEKSKRIIAKSAANQEWIADAPTVVLLCSEPKRLEAEFGKRAKELYDIQNIAMAAENLMLAAWHYGVGSCFVSSFTEPLMRKQLKIPNSVHVHGIVALGYPAEFPGGINRASVPDLTHFEEWGGKIMPELKIISGIMHPEKTEVRFGEEAEKVTRKVIKTVKKKVKEHMKKRKKA